MTGFCLSLAPILRCESLTRIESEVLIIPPALELMFSVSLVFMNWGKSRTSFLLAAEGLVFFSLALIDLLAHIFPATRNSLDVFRILDIFIGAASFIPILCYVLFLFFFLRRDFLPSLPRRFQRIAQFTLMLFIPSIIAADLVGSFIGISYTYLPNPANPNLRLLAIGFANDANQMLWTFFSSLALALLTAYQALNFCIVFYRLIKSFVDQRRIELSGDSDHSVVLFKGLGWLAIGLKLGAIETVVGFALDGFGGPITRRILRFLSRACLTIGVVKGIDSREDFDVIDPLHTRSRSKRKSTLRLLISNPRQSTFRRMSEPLDPRLAQALANLGIERTNEKTYGTLGNSNSQPVPFPRSFNGVVAPSPVLTYKPRPTSRVTVLMTPGTAPTLDLRFSALDMPSPCEIQEILEQETQSQMQSPSQSRPQSLGTVQLFAASHRSRSRSQGTSHLLLHTGDVFDTRSSFFDAASIPPASPMPMPDIPELEKPARARTKSWMYSDKMELGNARDSGISGNSVTTLEGLHGFGPRRSFTLPAMVQEDEDRSRSRSSVNSFDEQDDLASEKSLGADLSRGVSQKTYKGAASVDKQRMSPMPADASESEDESAHEHGKGKESRWKSYNSNSHYSLSSLASTSSLSREGAASPQSRLNLSNIIAQRSQASSPWVSRRMPSSYRAVTAQEIDMYDRASSRASSILENEGSSRPRPSTDTQISEYPQHVNARLTDGAERSPRPDLVRLKSVGNAPRKETPTPLESPYVRDQGEIGHDLEVMPSWEAYSSSTPSTASPSSASLRGKPVSRYDSHVLSREDQARLRNSMYERDEEGIVWVGNEARAV
ncbi:hypothetical protein OE88DRAFT_1656687 [Heliocybe sulcata]|uniref:Uncharacterized protein n=1 Tax=Heliocybe sulcata TaxID=5364 RepID=A0A5C3N6D5_9AGAM|nr:hypothetical protein OE88DRAFT_1656687 [Heliocybe sulcata]